MSGLSNCQCTSCSFEFNLKWGPNENRSKRQCMCCMQCWLLFFAPFSVDHVENRPKRECLRCLVGNTAPSQSPLGTISQTSCHLCQPCYKNLANTSSGNMQKNYHKVDFIWGLYGKNALLFKLDFFSQTYVMRSFWKYFWRCILGGWYTVAAVVFYGLSLVSFVGFLLLTKGIQLWPHFYNLVKFGQNKNQVEIWIGFLKEFEMLLISWFNEDLHFRDSPKSHITCQSNQS